MQQRGLKARALGLRHDAKCLTALAVMRLALTVRGYAAIKAWMPQGRAATEAHFYARQLARRIERLAQAVPGASCLTQALALQWLMARSGYACELLVGVRRDETGRFAAHAWVACNGRIVLGAATTNLAEFTRMEGAR